jgi:hypothetical protein
MNGKPIINELNNGTLSTIHAMPLKGINSDNTESFAIDRNLFEKAYQPPIDFSKKQTTRSFFQRHTPAIHNGFVIDGPKSVQQKKWIGGNRDSSSVTRNRRINSTGSILSKTGPQSFNTVKDTTTYIDALSRVRGAGYRTPIMVGYKNVKTFNPFTR